MLLDIDKIDSNIVYNNFYLNCFKKEVDICTQMTLELLAKQWCTLNDLMMLTNLGRNSALKIRKEIINDLENKGYKLPCGLIPMCEVVNKLNIN